MSPYRYGMINQTATQDLSAGAMTFTYEMQHDGYLSAIYIGFSTGSSNTITVTYDSADGSGFDIPLDAETLSNNTSYKYTPGYKTNPLNKGDIVKVTITTGGSATASLTAKILEEPTWTF